MKQSPILRSAFGVPCLLMALLLLAPQPNTSAQYTGGILAGSTVGQNLRNTAATMRNQMDALNSAADNWSRRAAFVNYSDAQFHQDFAIVQSSFQQLRSQFNYLGRLAAQLGRPTADNSVAELNAGLDVIAELFAFLANQYASGTLDRATIARTARVFQSAIQEWDREFRQNSSRLGLAY